MKRDEAMKLAERGLAELNAALEQGASETLVRYLDVLARFHRYSFGNVLLIASQKPDAHPRSKEVVRQAIQRFQRQGVMDDPLLSFVQELEGGSPAPYGETVNLVPLFTCQGALEDVSVGSIASDLRRRMKNADQLSAIVSRQGWKPLVPAREFRSGILLLQVDAIHLRRSPPDVLRRRFHQAGLAVSTYPQGLVRISLPAEPWHASDLDHLQRAFRHVAEANSDPALPVRAHAIASL